MPTITTNATGGGLFNSGSTWAGGVVPSAGDDIVIVAGDTLILDDDFNCGTVDMTAGTSFTSPTNKTLDPNADVVVREGCTLNGLTITSTTVGTGTLQIGPASNIQVNILDCTINCAALFTASANLDLTGSNLASLGLVQGSGKTITGGNIQYLSDQASSGSQTVAFSGTLIANMPTWNSGDYWTVTFTNCNLTNVILQHVTANYIDCEINYVSNDGFASLSSAFSNCLIANLTLQGSSGVPVAIDVIDCVMSNVTLNGYDGTGTAKLTATGDATVFNGVTVNAYGILEVPAALPDAAWASVAANTNAYLYGHILVSAISMLGGNVLFGSAGGIIDVFTVKASTTLASPIFNGGDWYIYGSAQLSWAAASTVTTTNFHLMSKAASIAADSINISSGVSGVPAVAYRGLI